MHNNTKNPKKIRVHSPAKINTFLQVHQRRNDGFHHLKTYFQLIDLCDELTFTINQTGIIRVTNPAVAIDETQDLCYRAAQLLHAYCPDKGVIIHVEKHIPSGGGLGGGSSNAATTLVMLNKLWNVGLSQKQLLDLGLSLGSDVPVFIHGCSTYAEGRGEIFHTTPKDKKLINQTVIVANPRISVATAEIFNSPSLTKRIATGKIRDLDTVRYHNDFETVVYTLYPEISQAAQRLSAYSTAYLTGTGGCLYAVLDDVKKADKIVHALGGDYDIFVAKTIEQSPLNEFK